MKQYILAFGATLLLSGCGIYTRYEAQTTVPDNLYGDEAETVATDTVGLGSVWETSAGAISSVILICRN